MSYYNFVRSCSDQELTLENDEISQLTGSKAVNMYLEELSEDSLCKKSNSTPEKLPVCAKKEVISISDKELLFIVEQNRVNILKQVLDCHPHKIDIVDNYGWSLLMIACQANSVDIVKELLLRGANTSIRDKSGNSALSLIIKNRNYLLADLFTNFKNIKSKRKTKKCTITKVLQEYTCPTCNNIFPDKNEHLSSTLHNYNSSKGKTMPANYVIPESNKGFQIMLKIGWDKQLGLGPDGTGNRYPIKAKQKLDKKGLGKKDEKNRNKPTEICILNKKNILIKSQNDKKLEICFRREFY